MHLSEGAGVGSYIPALGLDKVEEWMSSLDDDLFGGGRTRTRQSRAQKGAERHAYAKDMAENDDLALADVQSEEDPHSLDISVVQLRTLQLTDIALEAVDEQQMVNLVQLELVSPEGMGCCIAFGPHLDMMRR